MAKRFLWMYLIIRLPLFKDIGHYTVEFDGIHNTLHIFVNPINDFSDVKTMQPTISVRVYTMLENKSKKQ